MLKGHKSAIHSQCELMKVKAGVTSFKQLITGNLETQGMLHAVETIHLS